MHVFGPKYIGHSITINVLRGFILELELTEEDTVLLHPDDYDSLVLEYRSTYKASIPDPFFLLGVLVDEADATEHVPKNRVVALGDDTRPKRVVMAREATTLTDDGRTLYRCGHCGGLTTPDGLPIFGELRSQYINWLKTRPDASTVTVRGECCMRA